MKNVDEETHDNSKLLGYSISLGETLHKRIEKHILLLKHHKDPNYTKQIWILDAFQEKLERDGSKEDPAMAKARLLHFKINSIVHEKIQKTVDVMKKSRRSYSKKQWFVEAISEKLEREEKKMRELLEKEKQPTS